MDEMKNSHLSQSESQVREITVWLVQEAEKPDSATAKFLNFFLVEFALDHLSRENQKAFLSRLALDEEGAIDFAASQIPDFEKKLEEALVRKIFNLGKELDEQS